MANKDTQGVERKAVTAPSFKLSPKQEKFFSLLAGAHEITFFNQRMRSDYNVKYRKRRVKAGDTRVVNSLVMLGFIFVEEAENKEAEYYVYLNYPVAIQYLKDRYEYDKFRYGSGDKEVIRQGRIIEVLESNRDIVEQVSRVVDNL